MLTGLRQFLNSKPWLGWVLACALLVLTVVMYVRLRPGSGTYSVERMSEEVTIRCSETGKEWTITRGLMEKELRARGAVLDSGQGLMNADTGKYTGFPVDRDWKETISRINREKAEIQSGVRGRNSKSK